MGDFYVVATPIGNLKDITERAIETLRSVDYVIAEDTRVTKQLLNHFEISKKMISCHKYSEREKAEEILALIMEGNSLAYVTDAGTPAISDPGAILVGFLAENGVNIIAIPGASAVISALSISGINQKEFSFLGFLGRTKSSRRERLFEEMTSSVPVIVIYESPNRIIDCMSSVMEVFPDADVVVCNDLTKRYEKVYRGKICDVIDELQENAKSDKGEYVVVINKNYQHIVSQTEYSIQAKLIDIMVKENMTVKDAVKMLSKDKNLSKNEIYQASLELKDLFR